MRRGTRSLLVLVLLTSLLVLAVREQRAPRAPRAESSSVEPRPEQGLGAGDAGRDSAPRDAALEGTRSDALEREPALLVRVRSESGTPIAGAAVQGSRGESLLDLGATDARGELRVALGESGLDELAARADGFAPASRRVDETVADTLDLVLRAGGDLPGRVLLASGAPAGAGLFVLAFDESQASTAAFAARALRGDLRAQLARTADDGGFVLRGLDPRRLHTALAAGAGRISPEPERRVELAMGELVLVVERAYVAWLRLREEGGAPVRTPLELYGRRFGTVRGEGGGARSMSSDMVQVPLLLGAPLAERSGLRDRFCIFSSALEASELGPFEISLDHPGYEPLRASFHVPALGPAGPAEILVELRPRAEAFGVLELRFRTRLAGLAPTSEVEPLALLRLFDESGRACEYAVRHSFPELLRLDALPVGRYRWELETLNGEFNTSAAGLEHELVLGAEGATLDIDLSSLGALEVELVQRNGSRYHGAASIRLERAGAAGLPARIFRAPPYLLAGLLPGTYEVLLETPRFLDRSLATAKSFARNATVEPERVSRVELRLPE